MCGNWVSGILHNSFAAVLRDGISFPVPLLAPSGPHPDSKFGLRESLIRTFKLGSSVS